VVVFYNFAVTEDKGLCVIDGLAGLSLCVCVCVCLYVCVYVYIYLKYMEFPLCSEVLVRGFLNHFAVNAHKGPCVVAELAGLSLCVFVFIYVCVYVYIYKK
jgi:hypothetical protein